jgi:F-type H+-transporting ATPase subunit b
MNILRHIISTGVAMTIATSSYAEEITHVDSHSNVAEHASSGGLPQFDPTWFASQVFWLIISFAILYVIFAKKTLPAISATIDRRRQQIDSDMETTGTLAQESETTLEAYQTNLKESHLKARAVVTKVEQDLKATAEANQEKFREKAEKKMLKTEQVIIEAKDAALKEIQSMTSDVVTETVKKLLNREVDKKSVEKTVDALAKKTVKTKKTTTKVKKAA